jgi:8-oxo-dGTP pyrophosphatase MutT (NUDIX family)
MNSELYNKTYKLPTDILKHIQKVLTSYPNGEGVKRAKHLLKNKYVTYQSLKRLKNFFDHYNGDNQQQYELAGGNLMKSFVEKTLQNDRDAAKRSDKIKSDITNDPNLGTKPQQTPRLNEYDGSVDGTINGAKDDLKKNALGIIVNNDNQILLLKRNPNIEQWQPGKWALVGGSVEEGETPEEACKREIKEEIGLNINQFKEKFNIQRNPDSIEYIFILKYDDDPLDIRLNFEHIKYGWFSPEEIRFLDYVPNLIDYINIAFKKYD